MKELSINQKEVTIILKKFIQTYVESSGCQGVVLGLSGGVDSAVTAVLCKEALGAQKVQCLFLPDKTTPPIDKKHIQLFIKKFHMQCKDIDISPLVERFHSLVGKSKQMTVANIKPRVRMTLLYEYANETNYLVCGASNKSELLVGYFTKYGDGGVDLQPLGDLYKTQIYQLATYLKIPSVIVKKPPTAGLWLGQTDEKELQMSYQTLDKILYGLELKWNVADIQTFANASKAQVERIRRMRITSQHKRRTPLIPKIGVRTPGLDWRSPVQEG